MRGDRGSRKILFFVAAALLLVASPLLAACAPPAPPPAPKVAAGPPIRIGRVDLYTGPAALVAEAGRNALEMYKDKLNAAGGVLGRPVEFLYRDAANPEEAVRIARDYATVDKVDAIMGAYSSAFVMALSEFAKANKVLLLAHAGKSSKITEELWHRYVFRTDINTTIEGRVIAQVIADRNLTYKKYYTLANDYEYGHAVIDEFAAQLKKVKPDAQIVSQAWPPFGSKEYAPYVSAIIGAKPDALVTSIWGTDWMNFVKAASDLGLWDKVPVIANMGGIWDFNKALGKAVPQGILMGADIAQWLDIPEARGFVNDYKARYKAEIPGLGAYLEYLTAQFYFEAVKKAGTTDTEKVIDALEGLQIVTPIGSMYIRAVDHQTNRAAFWGVSKWSDEWNNTIITDLKKYSGEAFWHSEDEIKALRAKAR